MNNQLTTFNFEGANVQAITDEKGGLWFVAKDVAAIFGYSDTQAMTRRLDDDELESYTDNSSGQVRKVSIINESGLYNSISGSTKPEAKKFKKWVNSEVLPSIRKTGSYSVNPAPNLNDPALLRTLLLDNVNKVIELQETVAEKEEVIAEQAPKVAALELLSGSEGNLCLRDAAKTLKIPPQKFNAYLNEKKYIYKRGGAGDWIAHQPRIQSGILEHKPVLVPIGNGANITKSQVVVTPKGLTKLAEIFSGGAATGDLNHA